MEFNEGGIITSSNSNTKAQLEPDCDKQKNADGIWS